VISLVSEERADRLPAERAETRALVAHGVAGSR
jgi:hypothetical protein